MKLPFMKKSVRFSELLPAWRFNPNNGASWSEWSTDRAIKYGYKTNSYVYACVNLIAKSASSIPWVVYTKKGNKTWEIVEDHPASLLIEKPNPFMSRNDLIEIMTMHMYLGGNAVLTKVRAGGKPSELWILPPDAIKVIPDKRAYIGGYLYERDGVKMRFDQRDIIHNKFNDPANVYWGISPLQAGAKIVDTDSEATEWNKIALENRAITDGVFTFESPLTKDQWEDARAMVRDQHQGISNARTPWILGAGAKWQQMSLSPAEMDFIESRKMSREEICSIFNVPPVMVGVYENATLANIETARKIYWQDTVVPFLENIKSCLNLQLINEYGDNLFFDFDLTGVEALQENWNDKIVNAKSLWGMGVPFNAINQRLELGFDDIDSGDMGFLPSSVLPADTAMNPPEPQPVAVDPNAQPPDPNAKDPNATGEPKAGGKSIKSLNLPSQEHKDHYYKSFEQRRTMWDLSLTRKASHIFNAEAEAVIEAVKSAPRTKEGIERAIDQAINKKAWNSFFVDNWTAIVDEFAQDTFENLKGHKPTETKFFEFLNSIIRRYIIGTAGSKVKGVCDFTKSNIGGIVMSIFDKDASAPTDEVARAVKSTYQDFSRYRSYRIGRTEVAGATNYGSMTGAKASGIVKTKTWLSSKDERVRRSHTQRHGVDNETVPLDAKFSNGLSFPSDYNAGKPSESIQCRCVLIYND